MDQEQATGSGQITADDVAKVAGVSRWTVTRAFKKDASISPRARAKVLQAAEALGYAPDLQAASLASDRSNLVALVLDDFENPHKLVMLEQLTKSLRRAGYGTLLVNMLDGDDASSALISASQRRVDAAVVIGTRFDDDLLETARASKRVRKLIVFARISRNPETISISCQDDEAMRVIGAHLLERGRTRPVFLAGPDSQSAMLNRKETFLNYWAERSGAVPPVIHADRYAASSATDAVMRLFTERTGADRPDVVICENDVLALGAMDALRHNLRLRVPEDVAVTGFDDIPLAGSPAYSITTFRQPIPEMAEALVAILDGKTHSDVQIEGVFVARQSA